MNPIYKPSFFIYLILGLLGALMMIVFSSLIGSPVEHPLSAFFIGGLIAGVIWYIFST